MVIKRCFVRDNFFFRCRYIYVLSILSENLPIQVGDLHDKEEINQTKEGDTIKTVSKKLGFLQLSSQLNMITTSLHEINYLSPYNIDMLDYCDVLYQ